jgi:hypothetical protein
MSYTDVFGNFGTPPSEFGFQELTISVNTTTEWPYNSSGGTNISKIMDVTATVAGLTLTLPDATEVSVGEDILIRNVGTENFEIVDNASSAVATVVPGVARYLYLRTNTTAAGSWGVITYGAGSSSVDASMLVGYGLIALGDTLNQAHDVTSTASSFTVGVANRAELINYTGGTITATFDPVATLGDNFFVLIRNSGSGVLTLDPSGAETIDSATSIDLNPGESTFVICSGAALFTVGIGRSLTYNFTQLVKDVSIGGTITLTPTEANNKLLTFVGNPAADYDVVVPNSVAVYYMFVDTSTSTDATVRTAAGVGVPVGQGQRAVLICDGSEVYSAVSITAGSTISLIDGSDALPSLSFLSQTNTGMYKYSGDGYGFSVNGVARYTDDGTTITAGSLTGIIKRTAGVESVAVAGTDYATVAQVNTADSNALAYAIALG